MKIGILTQPLNNNYGGLLQNYALQQVLKAMGHVVETVDWEPEMQSPIKEWLYYQKTLLLSRFVKPVQKPRYQLNKTEKAVIGRNTSRFIERYICVCPQRFHNPKEFETIDDKYQYEAYVVGSDQVWRPRYNANMMGVMFLDFVKRDNVKRLSYAASFGTSEWEFEPTMTETCAKLAKRFDLVTVREKSGVDLCKEYLGVKATHVLDPTMLLSKEDYIHIVEAENEPESAGTLFYYILDPSEEKKALIEGLATKHGLNPFTIMPKCQAENRTKADVRTRIENCVFPSVTSWLRSFVDARMVVVDSFHGAVFSIIFNKPFWVIANAKRGNARFESLLEMFGLEDRMVSTDYLNKNFDWDKAINWETVNKIRLTEVNKCKSLLEGSLKI